MLVRMVKNEFRQILHPNAVLPLKIDGVNVPMQKRVTLLAFLTTYLIICLVISFTMIAMGIGKMVLLADDAHRTSGDIQRTGNLHSSLLERELVSAGGRYWKS